MKGDEATDYRYWMPTRIVFGEGTLSHLPIAVGDSSSRVLVVSTGAMHRLGVLDRILELLGEDRTVVFSPVTPYPTPDVVDEAVTLYRDSGCAVVVGIGGGSALDVAKSAAVLQANPDPVRDYLTGRAKLERPGAPFVAIPTTSGTGSEVTPWATIWDMEHGHKHSLEHGWMFAKTAIVDPTLTKSLSPEQTALTGMDALTQAVEAYWSRNSQPISDIYALEAIRKISGNLRAAFSDALSERGDQARSAMSEGSLLSGLAFSNTHTTICHSLSYPMTARFGVPHGQAVSITLPEFLPWNADALAARLPALVAALGARDAADAAQRIRSLMADVGLATDFRALGLNKSEIDLVIKEGLDADRADNNPKQVTIDEARGILHAIS